MRKLNIFCLPGKSNLDFYQGALPEVYVFLHYLDTRHQSRVVIHNEVIIACRRDPINIVFVFLAFKAISLFSFRIRSKVCCTCM